MTYDVDGVILGSPKTKDSELAEVAAMAAERGWSHDWFNDAAVMFNPPAGNPGWQPIIGTGKVTVTVAYQELLPAMKLNAARGRRDNGYLAFLLGTCTVTSFTDAETVLRTYYPNEALHFPAKAAVEQWLDREERKSRPPRAADQLLHEHGLGRP